MKKKRIAIIAHNCRTGGGLFGTLNLLEAFKNITEGERVLLVCSEGYGFEDIELPANSDVHVYKGSHRPIPRYIFESYTLPKIVNAYDPDVVFGPANIGLSKPKVPQAIFIRMPYILYDRKYYPDIDWRLQFRVMALRHQIKKSLPKTDLIFSQTPIVMKRFSENFSYPEEQINVLPLPTPAEIRPIEDCETPGFIDKSSDNFYFLVLTRYMIHRNPGVLLPLCEHYGEELRSKGIKFITAIEPEDHPHARGFLEEVSSNHLEDIIINIGHLCREEVLRYYFHSDVLWLPTMMETLCLPYLEAMTMEVPIMAPDLDFARYVCGGAALFYDPWDVKSIFDKIILLKDDSSLRQELVDKGKVELGDRTKFAENWEESAANIIKALNLLEK
ncbi:MAG: glycosyltransferase [Sedimentisphaerales bacterium]|nr:glycosyltransferase [Sedimentisphaerales bacterium]